MNTPPDDLPTRRQRHLDRVSTDYETHLRKTGHSELADDCETCRVLREAVMVARDHLEIAIERRDRAAGI